MNTGGNVKVQLTPEGKFALRVMSCEGMVFILLVAIDKPELGFPACVSIAVLMIAIRLSWSLRKRRWYWVAVAIATALHVPLVLCIPWNDHAYRGKPLLLLSFLISPYAGFPSCLKMSKQKGRIANAALEGTVKAVPSSKNRVFQTSS